MPIRNGFKEFFVLLIFCLSNDKTRQYNVLFVLYSPMYIDFIQII